MTFLFCERGNHQISQKTHGGTGDDGKDNKENQANQTISKHFFSLIFKPKRVNDDNLKYMCRAYLAVNAC